MKCLNDYIVNVDNLKDNAENIKYLVGANTKFCAVVKANAYGLGVTTICRALKGIADFFACACFKESLDIRLIDKSTPVLILGYTEVGNLDIVSRQHISISVGSLEYLQDIVASVRSEVRIHLQVNTGLNRFGFKSLSSFKKALDIIDKNKNLVLEGVYSHFATKEQDKEFMAKQYMRFLQFKKVVKDNGVIFHLANSYGTISSSRYRFDMVRCGFLLYGYTENKIGNRPVLAIKSRLINILNVVKGQTVGYDRTYIAEKNMRVGVVSIGYADGIGRGISNNFDFVVNGKRCPIVGLVCMDVCMIDLGKCGAKLGDEVLILGRDRNNSISIYDYARTLKTSPYEILCAFKYNRMNYIVKNK